MSHDLRLNLHIVWIEDRISVAKQNPLVDRECLHDRRVVGRDADGDQHQIPMIEKTIVRVSVTKTPSPAKIAATLFGVSGEARNPAVRIANVTACIRASSVESCSR